MTIQIPANLIPAVNKMVRTSQTMFCESGRQPTAEELALRLAMPLEKVEKLLAIAPPPAGLPPLTPR
jgi:RNA polymerase primary sigma factor